MVMKIYGRWEDPRAEIDGLEVLAMKVKFKEKDSFVFNCICYQPLLSV